MFIARRYRKSELALVYFPEASSPDVALNRLRCWIKRCPELVAAMQGLKTQRQRYEYSADEVALIVEYLGAPDERYEIT